MGLPCWLSSKDLPAIAGDSFHPRVEKILWRRNGNPLQYSYLGNRMDREICLTFCDPMDSSIPGLPVLHHILEFAKFMSTELGMLPKHIIFCRPLLFLPSIFPSIRVFSNELALHIRWSRYETLALASFLSMSIQG